jgi:hypothetical protein
MNRPPLEAWTFLKEEVRLRGSTGAALRTLPSGRRVVVKRGGRAGGDPAAHIMNEYDMNRYLNELGIGVPSAEMVVEDGRPTMLTDFEEGARVPTESDRLRLREDFVPQVAISNWDVLGQDLDNVLIRPDGTPSYVDVGGAGPYRAMGAPKGDKFTGDVGTDIAGMQYMAPYTDMVYGDMTDEEMGRSYDKAGGVDAMQAATQVLRDAQTRNIIRQRAEDLARRVA